MSSFIEGVAREIEQLETDYLAGSARFARDPRQLDKLLERGAAVLKRIDQMPAVVLGPDLLRLRESLAQRMQEYVSERAANSPAPLLGPAGLAAREMTNLDILDAQYGRHFAGHERASRDLALIRDIVDEMKKTIARMDKLEGGSKVDGFDRARKSAKGVLIRYEIEVEEIAEGQKKGTPEQRANLLALLAKRQDDLYAIHFAGEPRVSRNPALLARIVASLTSIHERMVELQKGGFEAEFHVRNTAICADSLKTFEKELAEVRKIRKATPIREITNKLAIAANKLFEEHKMVYGDVVRLGHICDKLYEIRRQMLELSGIEANDLNARNIDIVTEKLLEYERQYEAATQKES